MTNVQLLALKKDAQDFIEKSSIEVLGVRAEVGKKVIDLLLNEQFAEIAPRHLKKLYDVVKTDVTDGLYRTADCELFLKAADDATEHRLMIGVTGDTGAGKSYMSHAVAKKTNVLYYNVHMKKSARVFFQDLLRNMNVPFTGNISEMINRTARALNDRENPLLIIDEADKMHRDIRSALHTLRDRTLTNCGILLVGMPALKNDLIRGAEQGKQGYAEFKRRVNMWRHLDGLQPQEIKKVLEDNDMATPELIREFRQYKSFGELINAITVYKLINEQ